MSLKAEDYLSFIQSARGYYSNFPINAPMFNETGRYSNGTPWTVSGYDMADGIASPTLPRYPNETMLIAPNTLASSLTASGGLTVTNDTTNFKWGTQSLKCVTDGTGGSNFLTLSIPATVDLSTAILGLAIEIDSYTPYSDFQIRLSSDAFVSSNFDFCKPIYTGLSQRWVEPNLWEYITINRGAAAGNMSPGQYQKSGTGLANAAAVNAIRFKFVDNGGGVPMTIRIGFLSYFSQPANAVVSLTADDSRLTQYTVMKPAMDVYRMRGTFYTIGYVVQNSTQYGTAYMNPTQLKSLQNDSNHEIGCHAFTDDTGPMAHTKGYDSLTASDGQMDLLQLRSYLRSQQALGIDSFALPHGDWSLNPSNTVNANSAVLDMMGTYFNTCATTYANTVETWPVANRLKLRRYVVQNSDTAATLMAMVNMAIANKWWLILAFHNFVSPASSSTDFLPSEFQSFIPQLAASGVSVRTVGDVYKNGI